MRTTRFFQLLYIFFVSGLAAQPVQHQYHLLIGTNSTEGKHSGIHPYRFDTQSGDFKWAQPLTELPDASYLAISQDKKNVYAISGGSVNAFAFNPVSGALTFMNSVPSTGTCLCFC